MQIIFYCQYVWGMGHLFRSLEFVRALRDHQVILIAGGQAVDIDLPDHVSLLRLPTLYMDEKFTRLIAADSEGNVEDIQRERKQRLVALFERERPDLLVVELYPFGRAVFGYELQPLLQSIRQGRFGRMKCVCSLRDILVEKKDPQAYEQRVLDNLNRYFDLLLIHSDEDLLRLDETFSRIDDIRIPVAYTGFIAQQSSPANGQKLRQALQISAGEKLIVASAGGGRSGYELLKGVLQACLLLGRSRRLRLELFAGPFMDEDEFEKLSDLSGSGLNVHRFTKRFLDFLYAADLSVSLAGYNTCMNLLVTRVPALVYPYSRQREQPIRIGKIKPFLPLRILKGKDLEPCALSRQMEKMLDRPPPFESLKLNVNGAENAARYLTRWADTEILDTDKHG
jgi:predicted glycosyltransferase